MPFTRYRSIIPDWEAFESTRYIPEPITIRVRRGKISAEELLPRLASQGFGLSAVQGVGDFYRVESGPGSIAQTLEYWMGLFHIQQAVMALPSLALAPRPGERVLDLCAAPGGKTAHMAELMEDRGPLVAVDLKEKRLRALLANIYRLGHSNVLVIAGDGRQLPLSALFDRVLVDAPCSAEGTFRRQEGKVPKRSPSFVTHVTKAQEALLRRGIALTRPGGTILYSTCTFAPEENEAIVNRILQDTAVQVEPIPIELPHSDGLPGWQGTEYHRSLRHAWRVYPHQMNAGGLFMALLRKVEAGAEVPLALADAGESMDTPGPTWAGSTWAGSSWAGSGSTGSDRAESVRGGTGWDEVPAGFPGEDLDSAKSRVARSIEEFESFFAFSPPYGSDPGWLVRRENIWAQTAGEWPLQAWQREDATGRWRVVSLGLRAFRDRGTGGEGVATPSSVFLSRWGRYLGPGRQIPLSNASLRSLLDKQSLRSPGLSPGAVALLWNGMVLGRGIVRVSGELVSEIASAQRDRLRAILAIERASDPAGR
jgi:NOL1/NOP2/sun family putative RNA methylase